ncbi:MAG: hypothetical protein RIC55_32125 [Pirellulaceae bacterium]
MSRRCQLVLRSFVVLAMMLAFAPLADSTAVGQEKPEPTAEGQQAEEKIDFEKARALIQKQRSGGKLTDEEAAYLNRARELRRRQQGRPDARPAGRPATRPGAPQPKSSLDLVPLTDLPAGEKYKGQTGGLYGEGRNTPPEKHLEAALAASAKIQPLDENGKPAADGKIVLISVGMSNTTQEFGQFVQMAKAALGRSSHVVVVDGAQGGQDASDWSNPEKRFRSDRDDVWTVLAQRLKQAGVTPQQVQVAWIKQARRNPAALGEFPGHADELQGHLQNIVQQLKQRFPNMRLAYLSSRIYAGYAGGPLNPEPYAYEGAFSVRGLIEKQIAGDAELNYDASVGEAKAPLLLWGPYLWANGEKGRQQDDLVWLREDLAGDGTHPSDSGRRKVAKLLLEFFQSDPTASPWFTNK